MAANGKAAALRSDSVGWLLAALLSAGAWWIPRFDPLPLDHATAEFVSHLALFLAGAFVGVLHPGRPWRWGVASVLAIGLADVVLMMGGSKAALPSEQEIWAYANAEALSWLLHALPVLAGAYIGALLYHAGLR